MKLIILSLLALAAFSQAEPTPVPTPVPTAPVDVVITITSDGDAGKFALSPELAFVINKLTHDRVADGTFNERFFAWIQAIGKDVMTREGFTPPSLIAKKAAIKAEAVKLDQAVEAAVVERAEEKK